MTDTDCECVLCSEMKMFATRLLIFRRFFLETSDPSSREWV